jgi:hypothetical protein
MVSSLFTFTPEAGNKSNPFKDSFEPVNLQAHAPKTRSTSHVLPTKPLIVLAEVERRRLNMGMAPEFLVACCQALLIGTFPTPRFRSHVLITV